MSLSFRHNGVLYVLDPDQIVKHLPPSLLADALRRGKAFRRSRQQAAREAAGAEARAVRRDRLVMGIDMEAECEPL